MEDIRNELLSLSHQAINIVNVQIRKRENDKLHLYKLLLFKVDMQFSDNTRDIMSLNPLFNFNIVVEFLKKNTSTVTQYKRCLYIGHSYNYCNEVPRCVKCEDKHQFKDCKLPRTAYVKCVKCDDPHSASYRGCFLFKQTTDRKENPTTVQRMLVKNSRSLIHKLYLITL